jgi:hypothetical protein
MNHDVDLRVEVFLRSFSQSEMETSGSTNMPIVMMKRKRLCINRWVLEGQDTVDSDGKLVAIA